MTKDIKILLKEAREAIKNKDFQSSIKLCKSILKDDRDNYMGLVFFGISLQEAGQFDQAPSAFKKAISINAENILAWNGLAQFYEKQEDDKSKRELVNTYISILELENNEKKIREICEKITSLDINHDSTSAISNAVSKIAQHSNYSDETKSHAWQVLVPFLSQYTVSNENHLKTYEEALKALVVNPKTMTINYYSDYLKCLHKQSKYSLLIAEAEVMHSTFESDTISLEWICKVYNELSIEGSEIPEGLSEKVKLYCEVLCKRSLNVAGMGHFTKALLLYENNDIIKAKELLAQVVSNRPGLIHAWYLLSKCLENVQFYNNALDAANKADKLLVSINNANKTMRALLDVLIVQILSRDSKRESWELAEEKCRMLLEAHPTSAQIIICLIRTETNLEHFAQAEELLSKLSELDTSELIIELLRVDLLMKQNQAREALQRLESLKKTDDYDYYMMLGILYFDMQEFDKCLIPFLKAAKLKPHSYVCFLYLGHYYQQTNDDDKARRCYEKAFKINIDSVEAGVELTKLYRKQKNWDANLNLLENVTSSKIDSSNQWAYLQLGLHFMELENYTKAIDCLRYIVRVQPNNSHYWETLADAYLARGSYTSALKSYQQAAKLVDDALYPLLQVANIKQTLGEYSEARADYESILMNNKKYVPALKGLSETCISQARIYRKNQLLGLARDAAQHALDSITKALQERPDMSCLWKIAADSCILTTKLPDKYCCMLVLAALAEGKDVNGNKALEKEELYILATRCYCMSLKLIDDNILIWHDLAVCYLSHAENSESKTAVNELYEKASACVQHCISKNPQYWQHWNLLGIIALRKEPKMYALAQHAFIKSLTLEQNSAIAWCNLGTMYLHLNDLPLANKAFSQAQRADPNYVNSWVGQALIAESMGHEDAMDLFRHSTQLCMHPESAMGYGHWVCQTLLQAPTHSNAYAIRNMHAVPVAQDALTWYTEQNPEDACALNILGILSERMGLNSTALSSFRKATRLCEVSFRDKANVNYGRLSMKLGKYPQAIDAFKEVREATFNSGSGLALTLFKDGQYEESYEAYESALHWLTDEQSFQSDLLAALASMALLYQGPEEAKTLLFQSIQLKPPSPWGLYATLSLGLLYEDQNLTMLVLKELRNLQDDKKCLPHYAVLLSYTYLLQGEDQKAFRELSKLVHRHPDQASLWLQLSVLLLRIQNRSYVSVAAKCAQVAMKLGRDNMDVTKVLCLVSFACYVNRDYKEALKFAQKAIHCYPDVAEAWCVLICTLSATAKKNLDVTKRVTHVKDKLKPSRLLDNWLTQQLTRN